MPLRIPLSENAWGGIGDIFGDSNMHRRFDVRHRDFFFLLFSKLSSLKTFSPSTNNISSFLMGSRGLSQKSISSITNSNVM